jgi:hypothetical protein
MQWSPHSHATAWDRSWTSCRITWASEEPTTPGGSTFSPYADFFDIGWNAPKLDLRGKVLLPILGDHYGGALDAGKLLPCFDEREGSFSV